MNNSSPILKRVGLLSAVIAVALLPFQDLFLNKSILGVIGGSPSIPFIILSALIFLKYNKKAFIFFLSFLLVSLAASLLGILLGHETRIADPKYVLLAKNITSFLIYALAIFVLRYGIAWRNGLALFVAISIMFIGIVSSGVLDANAVVHGTLNGNMRPRGFSTESSIFGASIVVMTMTYAAVVKNGLSRILAILICLASLYLAQSKGSITILFFSIVLSYIIRMNLNVSLLTKVASIVVVVLLFAAFVIEPLLRLFLTDIEEYTSLATRSTLIVSAIQVLLWNPLGVGFGDYAAALSSYIGSSIHLIQNSSPLMLNFSEVFGYSISRSTDYLSTKSMFFDVAIYFGWLGVIALIVYTFHVLRETRRKNFYYTLSALSALMSLLFFIPGLPALALAVGISAVHLDSRRGKYENTGSSA